MKPNIKMCFGMGAPTIIVTFVLLCLTTLSALSLTTAASEARLAEKTAEHSRAYYLAQAQAQEWAAQLDTEQPAARQTTAAALFPLSERLALSVSVDTGGPHCRVISQRLVVTDSWNYDDYAPEFNDAIPQQDKEQ